MFLFDKIFVQNSTNSWFANKMANDFQLQIGGNKSIVVFGYNGIGKSTIFKCIKSANDPSIDYLDYESKDDKILNDKKLEISVNINQIQSNQNQINVINKTYDASGILEDHYKITKIADCDKISKSLSTAKKNKKISFSKSRSDIDNFIKSHPNIDAKVLMELWENISNVVNSQTELDNDLKNKKYIAIKKAYDLLQDGDDTCPICDIKTPNLRVYLENKIKNLESYKSILIDKMEKYFKVDANIIDNYLSAYNDIKNDSALLVDYILCTGNIKVYDSMSTSITQRDNLMLQNNSLVQIAQSKYNSVKNQKDHLKKDFKRYFDIDSNDINFDDVNFKVTIKFSRNINTYSTGEINLMSFLFHIYSFIGSDKTTLILDDPASSLDLMNHYKIAFEIVRNSKFKHMVVLTHSVDFVNIINSQSPKEFDFYYLEECNNALSIKKINMNRTGNEVNVISLNQLASNDDFVKLLIAREEALANQQNDNNIEVFHYTLAEKFIDGDITKLSNHKLVALIDNFSGFVSSDFYSDSLIKIKYICALRVWVEKKLYEAIPVTSPIKNTFLGSHELGKKIEIVVPRDGSNPYNVGFTREELMSKKVMLNQGIHYHSKVMPMAYAINLSFDQLAKEINEIKQMF